MNPDARRYEARLRLYTRSLPSVLAGVAVFVSGYLTYQPPEQWQRSFELWGGLIFIGACLGATELISRLSLPLLGLDRREIRREGNDALRLTAATAGLAETGRPFYPAVVDLGQAPLQLAAPGGRLYIGAHLLRGIDPPQLRLLIMQAMEKLSMAVMLERILATAVVWWILALGLLRSPLGLPVTIGGAVVTIAVQLWLQEWLYRREQRAADQRVLEHADRDHLARAIAAHEALYGPAARERAHSRILALGVPADETQQALDAAFGG